MSNQDESITELMSPGARRLARSPRILDAVVAALAGIGLAGEERNAKILYLALTSRLLPRPVSVAVVGASSTGKSTLVERVSQLFPQSAYYVLPPSSDRFLVYDPEPLAHRMVVVGDAFAGGGHLSRSVLRTLLADGRLSYGTVVKNAVGKFETLRVDKDGPTGAVFSGAFELGPKDEPYCLCISTDHGPDQTRRVMETIASADGDADDLRPWQELQQRLSVGERRVWIPYAHALAKAIPATAPRLRRVFGWVRDLVGAHALLHRATREVGRRGVVATIEDYAVVHDLLDETLSAGIRIGATWSVRQTVRAVEEQLAGQVTSVSLATLAGALGVDRSRASRRVRAAIDLGYLRNEETRRGKPARVVLDARLPEDVGVLPPPRTVMQACADDGAEGMGDE